MIKSLQNTALVCAASILAGGICATLAWQFEGESGLVAALAATIVNVFVACVVMFFLSAAGQTVQAVMAATAIRMMLTLGIAGSVAYKFEEFRGASFLLVVGIGYLAGLFFETWLTLREGSRITSTIDS